MYCHSCGKEVADSAKFCPACGALLSAGEPSAEYNEAPVAEATATELYDVIVYNNKNAGFQANIALAKYISELPEMDLAKAAAMLKLDAFRILEAIELSEALEAASELERIGVKTDVIENGAPIEKIKDKPKKQTSASSAPSSDHKKRSFKALALEVGAYAVMTLACVLSIFCPLFVTSMEQSASIFSTTISMLGAIDFTRFDILSMFYVIPLVLLAIIIYLTVRTAIPAVKKAIKLVKFDEYYETELLGAKPESVAEFLKNRRYSLGTIILELVGDIIMFYAMAFTFTANIAIVTAVIIGALMIASCVMNEMAKRAKSNANQ